MASPYTYTFRRRLLMQVSMLALLAAMVGLAVLVRNMRLSVPSTPLGPSAAVGLFDVNLPKAWTVSTEWLKDWPPTPRLEANDPSGGRQLEVVQHLLAYSTTPESYLETFHKTQDLVPRPITIAGMPGILVEGVSERKTHYTAHRYVIAVTDQNLVLLLHLESPGASLTPIDRKLFADVIASVSRRQVE